MDVVKKLTGLLSLPKEIVLNLPLILMTGSEELNIENYKSIVEYTDAKIRIDTTAGMLILTGRRLVLKQITSESILVTGNIEGLSFFR